VAPPGGALLCSVLFRPPLPAEELHHVSSIVALAARGAAFATTGAEIGLKWPNDVVSIDGKLAGVLAEVVESAPAAVVVGIGFNLFFPPGWPSLEDAAEIGIQLAGATTLEAESGVVVSRDEFLEAFLDELDLMYARLIGSDGPAQIALRYRDACSTLGRVVRVETPTGELRGVAVDIRTDGALLIEVDGAVRAVTVADVVHLRPSERTT
jgi:BirA family biotin operon repressor/biotin-[acetyl-CoA-carboxylase] ligase